jgi:hypothetical protein
MILTSTRLEQYTLRRPQQVLIVHAHIDGTLDQILIFKGISSSLTRATAFDPEIPVMPEDAEIQTIDILQGPYSPDNPTYLQQGVTWEAFQPLLQAVGV